jgi:hypothetical protein
MASLNVSRTLVPQERALASDLNTNFSEVETFVNTSTVHSDGTNFPTTALPNIPVLPSSDPTGPNQATRKAYVDGLKAPNVAWGVVASAVGTTTQNIEGAGDWITLTGLSLTVTLTAGRLYRLAAVVPAKQTLPTTSVPAHAARCRIVRDVSSVFTVLQRVNQDVRAFNDEWTFAPWTVFEPAASGEHVFRVQGLVSTALCRWVTEIGTGTAGRSVFTVEDVGPAPS